MNSPVYYYVDGRFVPADQATLPLGDLAIVRGYGIFDFLRTYRRVPFKLHEHVLRLFSSAEQIGLAMPWSVGEVEKIVHETNDRNGFDAAAIRIVVTGGPSPDLMMPGQRPSLAVMIEPISPPPARQYAEGVGVTTTHMARILPTVKSLNYLGAILAVVEARKADAVEAIYRTPDGLVTEGTRSNLFIFREGKLLTPETGILPGITRQVVLEIAAGEYTVVKTDLTYDDLLGADEVFITSTTKEIVPVVKVDGQVVGGGRPGEYTQDLMERFRAYVDCCVAEAAV